MELRTGKSNCCVIGCSNAQYNTDSTVKFYRFPGKSYESARRSKWIAAVDRTMPDGSAWQPKSYTRICSRHFVGGKKAIEENSPSYIPTIFPIVPEGTLKKASHCKRLKQAQKARLKLTAIEKPPTSIDRPTDSVIFYHDKTTQIKFRFSKKYFEFSCSHEGNNVLTQANIGTFH